MKVRTGAFVGIIALLPTLALGQSEPLLKVTFENDAGGWKGFGDGAKVAGTHDAAKTKSSAGALQFDYTIAKGSSTGAMLPIEAGTLAKMRSLRFWVRADYTTAIVVTLNEKDGGHYNTIFTAPAEKWQQVELTPADFTLGTGKDEPKDPDGKLDPDKIESIGILDCSQFLLQSENPNFSKMITVQKGAHTLLVSDFTASAESVSSKPNPASSALILEPFARPQLAWFGIGEVEISQTSGKPLEMPSLKMEYHQMPDKVTAVMRSLPKGSLAGKSQLGITLASAKPAKVMVQLEESGGGKYNFLADVAGDRQPTDLFRSFTDFKRADDSKDSKQTLDLKLVEKIIIIDVSGFTDKADTDNTLWIGKLRALDAAPAAPAK